MGQMLLRSMDRAEVIYESMCLRGFDGVFRLKKEIRFCARDAVYLVLWIVIFAVFCGWTDDRNDVLAVKES